MNIKNPTIIISSLLLLALLNNSCVNDKKKIERTNVSNPDTTLRPANVSPQATLVNFGGDEIPVFVWVEPIGPLVVDGKTYSHIYGVKYTYVKPMQCDTMYYENIDLRNTSRKFNFKTCKILESAGDANIYLANGTDTMQMFLVLGCQEFNRVHRGIKFTDISTISLDMYGEYIADEDMECNIKKDKSGIYILTLNDGSSIMYKSNSKCNVSETSISFLNREDGRIYFYDKACYLELVNKEDVKIFQGLR